MEMLRFVLVLACCCRLVVSNVIDRKLIMKQELSTLSHTKVSNSPRTAVRSKGSSGFSAWLDHICTASKDCVPCADAKNGLEYCGPNSDDYTYDYSFYFGDTAFDYSFYSGKSDDSAVDGQCSQWTWTCNSTYTCFRVLSYKNGVDDDCEADFKCNQNQFQCPNSTVCIPCAKFRDGSNDCGDYSDEWISYSSKYFAVEGFVNCKAGSPFEGMTIPRSWLCDNYNDCGDASDESLDYCPERHCGKCEIKCNLTNICIPQRYYDNRYNDCGDNSDEPNYYLFDCFPNPCVHGACFDQVDGYTCYCDPGYKGTNCSIDIDDCSSDPCVHGSCIDRVRGYTCKCDLGYEGTNCDIPDVKCKKNEFQCRSSTVCIPCANIFDETFDCDDYSDETFQFIVDSTSAEGIFKCPAGSPNEGNTIPRSYLCDNVNDCGDASDESLHYCPERHCKNCLTKCNTTNMCVLQGYFNDMYTDCGEDNYHIDDCSSNPCHHGLCIEQVNGYTCSCYPGYEGANCDIDVDDCSSDPCHHGSCIDEVDGYTCYCDPGYEGTNCSINIDDCSSDLCIHGSCIDQVDGYTCKCDPGYEGAKCDIAVHKCKQSEFQCPNSTVCIPCGKLFDEINDCGDNSDETMYYLFDVSSLEGSVVYCPAGSPHAGIEIPMGGLCDNYNDCGDASDESLEYCPERHCGNCLQKCKTSNMCVPYGYYDDGNNKCGEDTD